MLLAQHAEILRRLLKVLRLGPMHDALAEFMQRSDVIEMGMSGYCRPGLVEQMPGGIMQARDPHAGIDQEVAVASPDVPDITLHDANDMRLPDPRDAVGQPLGLKPSIGNLQGHTYPPLTLSLKLSTHSRRRGFRRFCAARRFAGIPWHAAMPGAPRCSIRPRNPRPPGSNNRPGDHRRRCNGRTHG